MSDIEQRVRLFSKIPQGNQLSSVQDLEYYQNLMLWVQQVRMPHPLNPPNWEEMARELHKQEQFLETLPAEPTHLHIMHKLLKTQLVLLEPEADSFIEQQKITQPHEKQLPGQHQRQLAAQKLKQVRYEEILLQQRVQDREKLLKQQLLAQKRQNVHDGLEEDTQPQKRQKQEQNQELLKEQFESLQLQQKLDDLQLVKQKIKQIQLDHEQQMQNLQDMIQNLWKTHLVSLGTPPYRLQRMQNWEAITQNLWEAHRNLLAMQQ